MKNFGLALSGGGFRACLYHLGVIRFLRDAELLPRVSHITSVSGGSVIGAHLTLNWERYLGSDAEFEEVSEELLRFLQLDVRNRIVRRFPLTTMANFGRRTLRLGSRRQFTRAGLLELHYERYLLGDTGLFSLPESPKLYILATDVCEGSVCAFHRDGMLLQRRDAERAHRFEQISIGLATVPMAVAASSAFPGFFPPLKLRAREVGAKEGDFGTHAFTDGGIYDNIGLRMFYHLQRAALPAGVGFDADRELSDGDESGGESEPGGVAERTDSRQGGLGLDHIFVSDAGATFKVQSDGRSGGLLSTAMRSTDILMDRVNQMERESFQESRGSTFIPITKIVTRDHDPHAPHPEVQRHAAQIRTDMDRFSDLEITSLVQHGYCVARDVCRTETPELVEEIPAGSPWDPLAEKENTQSADLDRPEHSLQAARLLQRSADRRVISTLLSLKDWPTYVWVPISLVVILTLPYLLYKSHRTATQRGYVVDAIAETSPLYRRILGLLDGTASYDLAPAKFEEVDSLEPLDFTGFEVLSDNRIFDLRSWSRESDEHTMETFFHGRVRIRRGETANTHLRFRSQTDDDAIIFRCEPESLRPKYYRHRLPSGRYNWDLVLDFSKVPIGDDVEVVLEGLLPQGAQQQFDVEGGFQFNIPVDTGLAQVWMLMPEGRGYEKFEISGYPLENPEQRQTIIPATTVSLPIGSIATFQLINPRHHYRYDCHWKWAEAE